MKCVDKQIEVVEMSDQSQYLEYIGVYNADASIWGEVSYWFGGRLGIRNCLLCDVTHGLFRERSNWVQCSESLGVSFSTYHRDDAPQDVRDAANGNYPIVLGRTATEIKVVLNDSQIEACNGSPELRSRGCIATTVSRTPTAGVLKLLRPCTNIDDIYLETSANLFEIQLRRSTHGGFGYRLDDETRGFTNFARGNRSRHTN